MDVAEIAREADVFYADCPAVSNSGNIAGSLAAFVERHSGSRPLVCVTSGGTTVPLERKCVRYIDNFSAGTRGAMSTEEFLKAGYAVIFLTRTGSIQPFTLDLPSPDAIPLLQAVVDCEGEGPGRMREGPPAAAALAVLRRVARVQAEGTLLTIPFTTIFEYLQHLRHIGLALQPCGAHAMLYLAAAVSDFYVSWSDLAEHKIQSAEGPLNLSLQKVPKMMALLRAVWAPGAFVVSFKLETDEAILLDKAGGALERYGVHTVVANILHTRKDQVLIVQRRPQQQQQQQLLQQLAREQLVMESHRTPIAVPGAPLPTPAIDVTTGATLPAGAPASEPQPELKRTREGVALSVTQVRRAPSEPYIEAQLVLRVVALHRDFMAHRGPFALPP